MQQFLTVWFSWFLVNSDLFALISRCALCIAYIEPVWGARGYRVGGLYQRRERGLCTVHSTPRFYFSSGAKLIDLHLYHIMFSTCFVNTGEAPRVDGKTVDFQKVLRRISYGAGRDFVARGRPFRGQKRLAPLAKRSTCSKSRKTGATVDCV